MARAEAYRERDRIKAALAADILAFDPSVEAERLGATSWQAAGPWLAPLDSLFKLRRGRPDLSVVSSPLSVAKEGIDAVEVPDAPSEANGHRENAPNEPKLVDEGLSPQSAELTTGPEIGCAIEPERSATLNNEISPNEPTDESTPFVISGVPEDGCGDNALGEAKTNEPTDACENGTNDAICENATNEPGNCEIDRGTIPQSVAADEAPESYEDAVKRIRRTREEEVRKLNEQARKLAEAAMFARRAQRRERNTRNGARPKTAEVRAVHTRQRAQGGVTARQFDRIDERARTPLGSWETFHPPPN